MYSKTTRGQENSHPKLQKDILDTYPMPSVYIYTSFEEIIKGARYLWETEHLMYGYCLKDQCGLSFNYIIQTFP